MLMKNLVSPLNIERYDICIILVSITNGIHIIIWSLVS